MSGGDDRLPVVSVVVASSWAQLVPTAQQSKVNTTFILFKHGEAPFTASIYKMLIAPSLQIISFLKKLKKVFSFSRASQLMRSQVKERKQTMTSLQSD